MKNNMAFKMFRTHTFPFMSELSIDKCFIVVSGSQIKATNKIVKSIVKDFTGNFICIIISFVRVLRIRKTYIQCDEVIIMAFVWRVATWGIRMSRPGLKQITAFMTLFKEQLAMNRSCYDILSLLNITRFRPQQS